MSTRDPTPFLTEGEARLAAEDWDGAAAAFLRAVTVAPSSAIAHSKLGVALVHQKRLEDAAREFARAIELDPQYAPAYSNLGNVYRERGRLDEAVASYQKALAADPEYWIAHQNLGIVYKQQGRIGDAVREFRAATRLSLRAAEPRRLGPGGLAERTRSRLGCLSTGGMAALLVIAGVLLR